MSMGDESIKETKSRILGDKINHNNWGKSIEYKNKYSLVLDTNA